MMLTQETRETFDAEIAFLHITVSRLFFAFLKNVNWINVKLSHVGALEKLRGVMSFFC